MRSRTSSSGCLCSGTWFRQKTRWPSKLLRQLRTCFSRTTQRTFILNILYAHCRTCRTRYKSLRQLTWCRFWSLSCLTLEMQLTMEVRWSMWSIFFSRSLTSLALWSWIWRTTITELRIEWLRWARQESLKTWRSSFLKGFRTTRTIWRRDLTSLNSHSPRLTSKIRVRKLRIWASRGSRSFGKSSYQMLISRLKGAFSLTG